MPWCRRRGSKDIGRGPVATTVKPASGLVLFALVALLLALPPARAQAPAIVEFAAATAQRALSAEGSATLAAIRSDPAASELRIGHSAPAAVLAARALSLDTTAGSPIVLAGIDIKRSAHGLVSLHARDEGADSAVSLVIDGQDVLGDIRRREALYKLTPLGGGLTAVYRYDTSQLRRHPENWDELMRDITPDAAPRGDASGPGADSGDVIDIMVVYTSAARVEAGNIELFIQFAIDNTHRAYKNSDIKPRLRLVHAAETDYVLVSDLIQSVERLSDPDDGYMDEIHGLRDDHKADLVVLIVARDSQGICGAGFRIGFNYYPDLDFSDHGFSVIAQNCETSTYFAFAHEIGHNQGAAHDPDNTDDIVPGFGFPYGHGLCNTDHDWNTVMAYQSNREGTCSSEIPYFSSPLITYDGVPTGDAEVRDNRRVLNETAQRVANFRRSQPAPRHTLPLIVGADTPGLESFVRIINHSDEGGGIVRIFAVDDTGQRFGPVELHFDRFFEDVIHFNSTDLEQGNPDKGLPVGVGDGEGHWWLELDTPLDTEVLAYIRTTDGFLTSMHDVAREQGTNRIWVPFFNPATNRRQQSILRLVNPSDFETGVHIDFEDDEGWGPIFGAQLSLRPREAMQLTSQQLFEDVLSYSHGRGKWRLTVTPDRPILVMSLLWSADTGHLTNLSR